MIRFERNPFPGDGALRSLWASAWGEPGPTSFEPVLSRSLGHVGAYDGDRLVGFVNVAWDGGGHAFVLDTCVLPDQRRRGIGRGLVAEAIEIARLHEIQWLHVDYEPQLALFYERCGFRPTAAAVMRLTPGSG